MGVLESGIQHYKSLYTSYFVVYRVYHTLYVLSNGKGEKNEYSG